MRFNSVSKAIFVSLLLVIFGITGFAQGPKLPAGVTKGASVEGITALSEGALDVAPLQSYFKTTF